MTTTTTITARPSAQPLTGTEFVPMDQGDATVKATVNQIAALAPGTNLSYDPNTRTLSSSTGGDETLPLATTATAGLMSAADKAALDAAVAASDQATIVRRWVRNETGSTIAKGIPVHISTSNGTTPTVAPADASTEATAATTIGLTQEAISHQAYGWVVEVGRLEGINTSALTEGQIVWLSEATGAMTSTRPTQPAHGVILGYCVKQGAGTSGIMDVKVDNGLELSELHDVLTTGATTGSVLSLYADGLWKPRTLAAVATSGAYADLGGRPTLGSAAAASTTDFATAAQGAKADSAVQPASLGGAAALNVGTTAGTVAAGNAPAAAVAAHLAEADPHQQYLRPSELVAGSNISLDTTTTPGSVIIASTAPSGGTPGGNSGELQYNNAGVFAGVPNTSVDPATGNTTFSARWISARNSAASAPAITMTGTWFTGGTSTTTKPHFLIEPAGTTSTAWITGGTGFGLNAPSGFPGNLLDLQVNGTPVFRISSSGGVFPAGPITFGGVGSNIYYASSSIVINPSGTPAYSFDPSMLNVSSAAIGWTSSTYHNPVDLTILRDAANILAQRNGLNAQAFRLYNTYTSATNFERLNVRWTSNAAILDTEAGSGGGTLRGLKIGSAATSLLGFYGATPVAQGAAIADATDAASAVTQLNLLFARVRALGLIAT